MSPNRRPKPSKAPTLTRTHIPTDHPATGPLRAQNESSTVSTTLPTLATIARDALADILTIAHYADAYCVGAHPWDLGDHAPGCRRRVADDMTEQLRTLVAYARTYSGDAEAGIWSAMKFGYISDTLADELVNVAAGGDSAAAVSRAFLDTCEALGLEEPEAARECNSPAAEAGDGVTTTGQDSWPPARS